MLIGRLLLALGFLLVLLLPAWWLAGRILEAEARPFLRALAAAGLALVGYLSFVNLLGRLLQQSLLPAALYLALNAAALLYLWRRRPAELSPRPLLSTWRDWIGPLGAALLFALPQLLVALTTNFYDEAAASAIHLTAPNQFAEGVFPPRHNALPGVAIKYHYGFTILSGTARWLTGLTANSSIDLASTALWLFSFLLVFVWLRHLAFRRAPAFWGAFAVLLGGGLSWLYQTRIEAYTGINKYPPPTELTHKWDAAQSWLHNLYANGAAPSLHLRNADGSLSNLPWDIAAQFQQHAVSLGIALSLFAFFLFALWQKRPGLQPLLLLLNVLTFGVLTLGHAVFGSVAAVAAGLFLLGSWLRRRTRDKFVQGAAFGAGVALLGLAHGGLLSRGAQYGADAPTTFRHGFGYFSGGLAGFLHWNLAGFGLPLLLALAALALHRARRDPAQAERNILFTLLVLFAAFSYLVPQLMYYSSESASVEQYTEISKFFFATHLALALLSAFGVAYLLRRLPWPALLPGFAAMAIVPLAYLHTAAFSKEGKWRGFYRAPYFRNSVEEHMGDTLRALKQGPRETYFDASADERKVGYLSEMLVFGGSVFTLTPSAYERTGIGYRLAEAVVARRFAQSSRMLRLLPGAPEDCDCRWYYTRPAQDLAFLPALVRARFAKLVAESALVKRFEMGPRALYEVARPTRALDAGIENYLRPRVVAQSHAAWRAPLFYDYQDHQVREGDGVLELPEWLSHETVLLYTGRFPGDSQVSLVAGRLRDTDFRFGKRIEEVVERNGWGWTYRNPAGEGWEPEFERWMWDWDIPLIADLDHDGFDSQVAYRVRTGEWLLAPRSDKLPGPSLDAKERPFPLAGRFLPGSTGDLGLWTPLSTGMVTLKSLNTGQSVTFRWGGRVGDVLVPGDYDGDGYDEIAVWQRSNTTWYWRKAAGGPISQVTFGSATGVPLPADYNHDGKLDLAWWEPSANKIYVSFSQGRSVDRVIAVPPHSIPIFVNLY